MHTIKFEESTVPRRFCEYLWACKYRRMLRFLAVKIDMGEDKYLKFLRTKCEKEIVLCMAKNYL